MAAIERVAMTLGRLINETARGKRLQDLHHRGFGHRLVFLCVGRRLQVHGIEHVAHLSPERGVLLCSNHRSFFDQYVLMAVLYRAAGWPRRVFFPVRSNYFYETASGILVNGLMGGFAMYPPIFRDRARAEENKVTIDRLSELLAEPGVLVGMHPEGTRGKGPDPYRLLPAQPGIGQLIMRGRPVVVPAFINGLSNDLAREVMLNYAPGGGRAPVHIVFGPPLDFGELLAARPRPAQYKRVANHVLAAIARLGQEERRLRLAG